VLIPVIDTESMQAILAVFRGEGDSSVVGVSGARTASIDISSLARVLIEALTRTDNNRVATDTTVPVVPVQERLGVFPPNDPACR
jgi:hypothetical protein